MFRLAIILTLVLTSINVAFALDCPADKPHKRKVIDYTKPVTCTLVACTGAMQCPLDRSLPCSIVPVDCNRCSPPVTFDVCMGADENRAAENLLLELVQPIISLGR